MRTITTFELAEERIATIGRFSPAHQEAVARAFTRARRTGYLQLYSVAAESGVGTVGVPRCLAKPLAVMPTYLTVNTPPWGCALLAEKSRDGRTAYRLESRSDAGSGRRYLRLRSESA